MAVEAMFCRRSGPLTEGQREERELLAATIQVQFCYREDPPGYRSYPESWFTCVNLSSTYVEELEDDVTTGLEAIEAIERDMVPITRWSPSSDDTEDARSVLADADPCRRYRVVECSSDDGTGQRYRVVEVP